MPREVRELDEASCWRQLRTAYVGRLAYVVDHRPHVVPLNYVVDESHGRGCVVISLGEGTTWEAVRHGAPVAFQVDSTDATYHQGWSVVVHGHTDPLAHPAELGHLARLNLHPWAAGREVHPVRIVADAVTGRRLG